MKEISIHELKRNPLMIAIAKRWISRITLWQGY